MPALPPSLDFASLHRGDMALSARSLESVRHILLRRNSDNHVGEVIGVIIGIALIMGLLMYWGIKKQGSCEWRTPKKR